MNEIVRTTISQQKIAPQQDVSVKPLDIRGMSCRMLIDMLSSNQAFGTTGLAPILLGIAREANAGNKEAIAAQIDILSSSRLRSLAKQACMTLVRNAYVADLGNRSLTPETSKLLELPPLICALAGVHTDKSLAKGTAKVLHDLTSMLREQLIRGTSPKGTAPMSGLAFIEEALTDKSGRKLPARLKSEQIAPLPEKIGGLDRKELTRILRSLQSYPVSDGARFLQELVDGASRRLVDGKDTPNVEAFMAQMELLRDEGLREIAEDACVHLVETALEEDLARGVDKLGHDNSKVLKLSPTITAIAGENNTDLASRLGKVTHRVRENIDKAFTITYELSQENLKNESNHDKIKDYSDNSDESEVLASLLVDKFNMPTDQILVLDRKNLAEEWVNKIEKFEKIKKWLYENKKNARRTYNAIKGGTSDREALLEKLALIKADIVHLDGISKSVKPNGRENLFRSLARTSTYLREKKVSSSSGGWFNFTWSTGSTVKSKENGKAPAPRPGRNTTGGDVGKKRGLSEMFRDLLGLGGKKRSETQSARSRWFSGIMAKFAGVFGSGKVVEKTGIGDGFLSVDTRAPVTPIDAGQSRPNVPMGPAPKLDPGQRVNNGPIKLPPLEDQMDKDDL